MADCFSVTPDSLHLLANELRGVTDSMGKLQGDRDTWGRAVTAGLEECDHFDSGAFRDAGDRLAGFLGDWSNGIDQIKGKGEKLATSLDQAADAFWNTDNQLAQALSGGTSTSSAPSS